MFTFLVLALMLAFAFMSWENKTLHKHKGTFTILPPLAVYGQLKHSFQIPRVCSFEQNGGGPG